VEFPAGTQRWQHHSSALRQSLGGLATIISLIASLRIELRR
jgi:hypothetical protein